MREKYEVEYIALERNIKHKVHTQRKIPLDERKGRRYDQMSPNNKKIHLLLHVPNYSVQNVSVDMIYYTSISLYCSGIGDGVQEVEK